MLFWAQEKPRNLWKNSKNCTLAANILGKQEQSFLGLYHEVFPYHIAEYDICNEGHRPSGIRFLLAWRQVCPQTLNKFFLFFPLNLRRSRQDGGCDVLLGVSRCCMETACHLTEICMARGSQTRNKLIVHWGCGFTVPHPAYFISPNLDFFETELCGFWIAYSAKNFHQRRLLLKIVFFFIRREGENCLTHQAGLFKPVVLFHKSDTTSRDTLYGSILLESSISLTARLDRPNLHNKSDCFRRIGTNMMGWDYAQTLDVHGE